MHSVQAAPVITGVDVKYISDSNPAKAEFDRDIESSTAVQGRITGSLFSLSLTDSPSIGSGLSGNVSASYEQNGDIEGLGESRYRAGLGWFREYKQRGGAPFYRVSVGAGYVDSETQIRDAVVLDATASLNLQFTQFFDNTFGTQVISSMAETEVFDTTKLILFTTANFSPFARVVLRAGLRYVIGDEISTATPTLPIVNHAKVIEADNAFGGLEEERFAYLIDANSAIVEFGIGYSVSAAIEGNLLYRYVDTSADGDIGYDRSMLEFTLSLSL